MDIASRLAATLLVALAPSLGVAGTIEDGVNADLAAMEAEMDGKMPVRSAPKAAPTLVDALVNIAAPGTDDSWGNYHSEMAAERDRQNAAAAYQMATMPSYVDYGYAPVYFHAEICIDYQVTPGVWGVSCS